MSRAVIREEMTWRAKAYLTVCSVRHLVLGGFMLGAPLQFDSPAFVSLFQIIPRWAWVASLLIGGVHLAYAAIVRSEGHARTALTMSAAVSFMWATAFGLVVLEGTASVLATALFGSLGLKDLIVCAQPLRSPFERLSALYDGEPPRRTD